MLGHLHRGLDRDPVGIYLKPKRLSKSGQPFSITSMPIEYQIIAKAP